MFELMLLLGLALFALLFAKVGFMVLLVALVVFGGFVICKIGAFLLQLILIPFQIVGGLFLGLLAIPLAIVAIPLAMITVVGIVLAFVFGGLALVCALLGAL